MQERIDEIIRFLIEEISQLSDPVGLDLKKLSDMLLKEGYTEREIHKAVEWVITNLNNDQLSESAKPHSRQQPSLRILISEEQNFFTAEAYGYLIQLQSLGIVNALQVEQIIERCFLMGMNRVDVEGLKSVISQILLGKEIGNYNTDSVYHPGNDRIN
jgi:uncharacterized protein Smg (DUF494 family)